MTQVETVEIVFTGTPAEAIEMLRGYASGEYVEITVGTTTATPETVIVKARNRDVSDDAMAASYTRVASA